MARNLRLGSGFLRRYRLRDADGVAIDLSAFQYVCVVYKQGHDTFTFDTAPSLVLADAANGVVDVLFTPSDVTGQEGEAHGIFRLRDASNRLYTQNAPTYTVSAG